MPTAGHVLPDFDAGAVRAGVWKVDDLQTGHVRPLEDLPAAGFGPFDPLGSVARLLGLHVRGTGADASRGRVRFLGQ